MWRTVRFSQRCVELPEKRFACLFVLLVIVGQKEIVSWNGSKQAENAFYMLST